MPCEICDAYWVYPYRTIAFTAIPLLIQFIKSLGTNKIYLLAIICFAFFEMQLMSLFAASFYMAM